MTEKKIEKRLQEKEFYEVQEGFERTVKSRQTNFMYRLEE